MGTLTQAARQPQLQQQSWSDLPTQILARLALEGVQTLADWNALGRRRHQIFGITAAHVRMLDVIARGARC